MKEYNKGTEVKDFPEWSLFTSINQPLDESKYHIGYWTHSNSYLFFISDRHPNVINYRLAMINKDIFSTWKRISISGNINLEVDPIVYVMENVL